MKLALMRLLLIGVFYLVAQYVFHFTEALLLAFISEYIIDPWVSMKFK